MEEMRADVEELVVKYPSLKAHQVRYSLEKESGGGQAEVFSYTSFLREYEFKVETFDRISNQF